MKSRSFAVGVAILIIIASVLVYYAYSFHPVDLSVSRDSGITGYFPEKFKLSTDGGNASYIVFRDSNNTVIHVQSYSAGYANLSTFMILYVYKLNQTVKGPYSSISFQVESFSMSVSYGNRTISIPTTTGIVGQSQAIKAGDFYRSVTVVQSKGFLTIVVRPNPQYLAQVPTGKAAFNLQMNLLKIPIIGYMPVPAGNMSFDYRSNLTFT